ncbi:OadG family transporter subunit [Shewanella sp. 0m-4]
MASISEQLYDALGIMVLGMTLVFVFLSMLILAMNLVARKFGPLPQQNMSQGPSTQQQSDQAAVSPLMAAVITAAIHQHRKKV